MALRISVLQGYPSGQDKPPIDLDFTSSISLGRMGHILNLSQRKVCPHQLNNPVLQCINFEGAECGREWLTGG